MNKNPVSLNELLERLADLDFDVQFGNAFAKFCSEQMGTHIEYISSEQFEETTN